MSLFYLYQFKFANNSLCERKNWTYSGGGKFGAVFGKFGLGNLLGLLFFRFRPYSAPSPNRLVPVFSCEKALNVNK